MGTQDTARTGVRRSTATEWLTAWFLTRSARIRDERGDVPGWVLITVMSAAVVVALLSVARPQLKEIFTTAIHSVSN